MTQKKKNTTKAKSSGRTKRSSRKSTKPMQIIDGKSDVEEIKNLEELLGVKQANPFGTTNLSVLEEKMSEMGLSDLQGFAVHIGILPSGNKAALKNKIKKQFHSHAGAGAGYHINYNRPMVEPGSQAEKDILKILNS